MKLSNLKYRSWLSNLKLPVLIWLLGTLGSYAQENPPMPIEVEVRTARFLDFGAFTTGSSTGTVHVSHDSRPTTTGDAIIINSQDITSALFDVYANPGTIINLMPASNNFELTGSNGGSLFVNIDDSDFSTGPIFITTANSTTPNEVYMGGTLNVSNVNSENPPGNYSGTIIINFIQE
jgi:hypothetical protein